LTPDASTSPDCRWAATPCGRDPASAAPVRRPVPVCGGGDVALAKSIAHIPIWAFHGADDSVVKPKRSRDMIAALQAAVYAAAIPSISGRATILGTLPTVTRTVRLAIRPGRENELYQTPAADRVRGRPLDVPTARVGVLPGQAESGTPHLPRLGENPPTCPATPRSATKSKASPACTRASSGPPICATCDWRPCA